MRDNHKDGCRSRVFLAGISLCSIQDSRLQYFPKGSLRDGNDIILLLRNISSEEYLTRRYLDACVEEFSLSIIMYQKRCNMCRTIICCFIISILIFGCAGTEKIAPKPKINCCIIPFESRTGMQAGEAESVMDMLATSLQNTSRFIVIDRKHLNAILQEQGFQSAQEGGDGLAKAAKILAIHKMITGSIGKLGDKYVLNLKMIDVGTSEVTLAISRTYDDDLEDIDEEFLPSVVNEIMLAIDGPQKK